MLLCAFLLGLIYAADLVRLGDVRLKTVWERFSETHNKWIQDASHDEVGKLYRERADQTVLKYKLLVPVSDNLTEERTWYNGAVEVAAACQYYKIEAADKIVAKFVKKNLVTMDKVEAQLEVCMQSYKLAALYQVKKDLREMVEKGVKLKDFITHAKILLHHMLLSDYTLETGDLLELIDNAIGVFADDVAIKTVLLRIHQALSA